MKIEHVGLWVHDLAAMRAFYEKYFGAVANELYHNKVTGFQSYFLSFASGARLEIMTRADIVEPGTKQEMFGFTHLAFELGSEEKVDALVAELVADGFALLNGPRTTGDGYYEAVVEDLEGNRIELMK